MVGPADAGARSSWFLGLLAAACGIPPANYLAVRCHHVPLAEQEGWQALVRVPDRWSTPRPTSSIQTSFGNTVMVPTAANGSIVFARIQGAGVSGFEPLRASLYKARFDDGEAPRHVQRCEAGSLVGVEAYDSALAEPE